jgi:hypothetical protein
VNEQARSSVSGGKGDFLQDYRPSCLFKTQIYRLTQPFAALRETFKFFTQSRKGAKNCFIPKSAFRNIKV